MAAQLLRLSTDLTPVSPKGLLRELKDAVSTACQNKHWAFFRPVDDVIKFSHNGVNYRIDVAVATDEEARQRMGLPDNKMFYAQIQTRSGQTIATIIYPQNTGLVQLNTLITALQMSMEKRAFYTAIH